MGNTRDSFRKQLEHLLNCNNMEAGSDTPDFILAQYLDGCLQVYDAVTVIRDKWYGLNQHMPCDGGDPQSTPLPPPIEIPTRTLDDGWIQDAPHPGFI
jgi:hypothetical protein